MYLDVDLLFVFNERVKVSFDLFSAILLGIVCLVLIWSSAGVDLAVAIVSYFVATCM